MVTVRRGVRWLAEPLHLLVTLLSLLPIILVVAYVHAYRLAVPFRDEWNLNGQIAIAAKDGTLTLNNLLFVSGGHRTLFTNLATAASTLLQGWDLSTQSYVSVILAVFAFVLLLLLMRRSQRETFTLVLIPFSLLLFAVYRSYNWWSVRHSHWYFANVFFLAALWLVSRPHMKRSVFALALVFGWCATFSMATGMLIWPTLLIAFWLNGRRERWVYALWMVSAGISIALYVNHSGVIANTPHPDVRAGDATLSAGFPPLSTFAEFLLKYLGGSLITDEQKSLLTAVFGLIALVLFCVHVVLCWRAERDRWMIAPWLTVAAFALGSGVFIGLGRLNRNGVERAFAVQYTVASSLFWVALVAVAVIALRRFYRTDVVSPKIRVLMLVDIVLVVIAVGFYSNSVVTSLQSEVLLWGHDLQWDRRGSLLPAEQCAVNFPVSRVATCFDDIAEDASGDLFRLDHLAARHLSIYANMPPHSILPDEVRPESLILLATTNAWINVHGREWLLGGTAEANLFHIVARGNKLDEIVGIPSPLERVAIDGSQNSLVAMTQWLNNASEIWIVETADAASVVIPYVNELSNLGYKQVYRGSYVPPEAPLKLTIRGFDIVGDTLPILYRLGEHLALRAWTLENSVDVSACSPVTLRSLWSTNALLADDYSLTAVIVGSDGQGVARADGSPSDVDTDKWEPGGLHLDRRTVRVPCDLKPGDYSLLVGMYNGDNMQSLAVTTAGGALVGDQIYLTTLHIH